MAHGGGSDKISIPSTDVSQEESLHNASKAVLPLYQSPFSGDVEFESVHLRHQSNLIEIFFDLFLAADLATFTGAHSIVDRGSLVAYIGFFIIIWSTWFQITLHDVRFAQDSVYERVCKVFQFIIFIAFALVGADFSPEDGKEKDTRGKQAVLNFWLLSFTLLFSRVISVIQYSVVLCAPNRPARLKLPLILNIIVFVVSGAIFIGFSGVFTRAGDASNAGSSVAYVTWYLVLLFEIVATMQISHFWKEVNFENTHLTERMGLMTFIVIGEGAIGASKTTIEMMGRRDLEVEPVMLVICIILVLVLLWVLYFDNLPTHQRGSAWQSGWALVHLPLHLSFVGILEGSRQVAMMRFISQSLHNFVTKVNKYCLTKHYDGTVLGDKLLHLVDAYDFGVMHPTADQYIRMREVIHDISTVPGICSAQNTTDMTTVFNIQAFPFPRFNELLWHFATALFISDGAEEILPPDEKQDAFELLRRSVITIYLYYWSSVLVMLLTLIVLYRLSNSKAFEKYDVADYCSMGGRAVMALLAVSLLALYADTVAWMDFIVSRAMLPTLGGILTFVVLSDAIGRRLRVRAMKKSSPLLGTDRRSPPRGYDDAIGGLEALDTRTDTLRNRRPGQVRRVSNYHRLIPGGEPVHYREWQSHHRGDGRPF